MPDIVCKTFTLADNDIASVTAAMGELKKHYSDDPEGTLISTFEEVAALFRLARQTGMAVRFRDDGFPGLTVLWHWVGEGVGLSYILRDGRLRQINLMLAGVDLKGEAEAIEHFEGILGRNTLREHRLNAHDGTRPILVTLTTPTSDAGDGSYLLGMLLFAPFIEVSEMC
jgi:hypothetical protein